jgi:hypothetical protein
VGKRIAAVAFSVAVFGLVVSPATIGSSGCGPKPRPKPKEKSADKKPGRDVSPRGRDRAEGEERARPPAPVDLKGRLLAVGHTGSLRSHMTFFANAAGKMVPFPKTKIANELAEELLEELLDLVGARRLATMEAASKPMAMALVAPPGFSPHASVDPNIEPEIVAMISLGPKGRRRLEAIALAADKAWTTPWGARGYRVHYRTFWVWVTGKHAVLARRPQLLTGAHELLSPLLAKSSPQNTEMRVKASRLTRLLAATLGAELGRPAKLPHHERARKSVVNLLRGAESAFAGAGDLSASVSTASGDAVTVGLRLEAEPDTELRKWVSSMKTVPLELLGTFPGDGLSYSAEHLSKPFREASASVTRSVLVLIATELASRKVQTLANQKVASDVADALAGLTKAQAGPTYQTLWMDEKDGVGGIWVSEVSDPKAYRKSLRRLISLVAPMVDALVGSVMKQDASRMRPPSGTAKRPRRAKRSKRMTKVRFGRSRVVGKRVMVARVQLPQLSRKMRLFVRAVLGKQVVIASTRVGNRYVTVMGKGWKKRLAWLIRNRKSPEAPKDQWYKALAQLAGGAVNHGLVFSVSKLVSRTLKRAQSRLGAMGKKLRKQGDRSEAREADAIRSGLGVVLSRWSGSGEVFLTTRAVEGGVEWRLKVSGDEMKALMMPWLVFAMRPGSPRTKGAGKRGTPAKLPPPKVPGRSP